MLSFQRISAFPRSSRILLLKHAKKIHLPLKDSVLNNEEKLLKKYESSIYYSDYLEWNQLRVGYKEKLRAIQQFQRITQKKLVQSYTEPLPLMLKYMVETPVKENNPSAAELVDKNIIQFPFKDKNADIQSVAYAKNDTICNIEMEVKQRMELLNDADKHWNWMNDYENYPQPQEEGEEEIAATSVNYGTPNPRIPASNVPCGGCGALLHCRDSTIPGYIPSEIFVPHKSHGGVKLEGIKCQRCHFLENYNMALQVRVSAEDYPNVLKTIGAKEKALVILLIDLLDYPCSIWPGIIDLIGHKKPIVVVGNKIDLIPYDGKGFVHRIKNNMIQSLKEEGLGMANIKYVSLISSKTGFGVEELITKLQKLWRYNGDVYIVGCTNVGKSTLFNLLLQSDYCKQAAEDLLQRATTSPWPGTTLNLLKFPILRPTGWRLFTRAKRLNSARNLKAQENELLQVNTSGNTKVPSMIGHVDRTYSNKAAVDDENTSDLYAMSLRSGGGRYENEVGLDMRDPRFALCKWCYDTPGVVQPEQIVHIFTTDELVKMFPKKTIIPRTFILEPGSTIFIAGIARLDYCEGAGKYLFTVFASDELPVTICKTDAAEDIYAELLRSEAFVVPINNEERLKSWRGLEASKNFTVTGIDRRTSGADLVLSNAGWIAITPNTGEKCVVKGWTPEHRGIYLRNSLLPFAVRMRGKKIRGGCDYINKPI